MIKFPFAIAIAMVGSGVLPSGLQAAPVAPQGVRAAAGDLSVKDQVQYIQRARHPCGYGAGRGRAPCAPRGQHLGPTSPRSGAAFQPVPSTPRLGTEPGGSLRSGTNNAGTGRSGAAGGTLGGSGSTTSGSGGGAGSLGGGSTGSSSGGSSGGGL